MKIRHPLFTKTAGLAGSFLMQAWGDSLDIRYRYFGPDVDPRQAGLAERYIFSVWHEYLLLPVYRFCRANMYVLISRHADGELITEVGRHLRLRLVRGSTTRGSVEAVRQLMRRGENSHLALTVDGPRGPRRRVQKGVVYLAARTGLEIVPGGMGYHRPWRLPTWDRFALPRPWSLATIVAGEPIKVPADADREQVEWYRDLVEARMHEMSGLAEEWAETGRAPQRQPAADGSRFPNTRLTRGIAG
jgi:lysophospholipid acyltransferase (LPLAT)-like uncharacterized protein